MDPNTPRRVLGQLLAEAERRYGKKQKQKADALRSTITLYQPGKAASVNAARLSTATRESLDDLSTFLGIANLYVKGNKAFSNKDKLVKRIIQEFKILQEASTCLECGEAFMFERGRQELLRCFLCQQPSHDCEMILGTLEARGPEMVRYLTSEVWLCGGCYTPRTLEASCNVSLRETPARKTATSRLALNSPVTRRRERVRQTPQQALVTTLLVTVRCSFPLQKTSRRPYGKQQKKAKREEEM